MKKPSKATEISVYLQQFKSRREHKTLTLATWLTELTKLHTEFQKKTRVLSLQPQAYIPI